MNKRINLNFWLIIMAIAIAAKFLLFYNLVDISSNFVIVVAISTIFTYGLFFVFKRKIIPSVIYLLFSVIMFCDWTYYSFFSRYLSLTLLGSAEVIGDIKESIIEVIKPINFLLILDAAIIFAVYLIICIYKKRTQRTLMEDFVIACSRELYSWIVLMLSIRQVDGKYRCITDYFATFIKDFSKIAICFGVIVIRIPKDISAILKAERNNKFIQDECCKSIEEEENKIFLKKKTKYAENEAGDEKHAIETDNNVMRGKSAFGKMRVDIARTAAALIMIGILVFSYSFGYSDGIATSIKNQELYNYHVSDVIETIFDDGKGSLAAFKDTYRKEKGGKLFGIAKDRNLVFIQMESFMNFVIDREYNGQVLTPNLNALIRNDSTYFDNFYQQIGSGNTSDAEFAANNSIYGASLSYTYKLYGETNYFRGLPVLLKEKGYDVAAFHAFEDMDFWNRKNAYPNLGFDKYFGGLQGREGYYKMTEWVGWGLSDSEFFDQTVPLIQKNLEEPYYAFINTLTNHHPFQMLEHHKFIQLLPEDEDTIVGHYLQSVAYTDYAIGLLLEELKAEDMYNDSIFVLYGDHAGLTHSEETDKGMERLLGRKYDCDTLLRVPMIIHVPEASQELPERISVSGGHLDILPTVAYLMGFDELDTVYFGHNLYNVKENLVAEQTFIKRGSFVYGDVMYEMALDGVYENGRAWNMKTGEAVDLDEIREQYIKTMDIIESSEYILKTDALRSIYDESTD